MITHSWTRNEQKKVNAQTITNGTIE